VLAITDETFEANPFSRRENSAEVKLSWPAYQDEVAATVSMPSNARAHLSTQRKTMAYGRYSENRFCCSLNFCRSFSAVAMYCRKPKARRSISRPRALRRGIKKKGS